MREVGESVSVLREEAGRVRMSVWVKGLCESGVEGVKVAILKQDGITSTVCFQGQEGREVREAVLRERASLILDIAIRGKNWERQTSGVLPPPGEGEGSS